MSLVRRRLIGLAAGFTVLLALAFGAALIERHDALKSEADAADAKLIGYHAADVSEVVLENANGRFVMKREGTAWRLREPMAVAADAATIDAIVTAIADVARTQKVEIDGKPPAPDQRAMFGLALPRASVTLKREASEKTLDIGKRNDFTGDVYARVRDSDAVAMVGSAIEFQVDKTLFDLREKRLLVFDPSDIERLDVTRPNNGGTYTIVRENGEPMLMLAGGTQVAGDTTQVSGLESALANLRAIKFVDQMPSGGAKALARLTLRGGAVHTIVLSEDADDHWFATLEGEPAPVAEVSGDWVVRKLDVDPKTLRDMRVLHFARQDVGRITVKRDDAAVTLTLDDAGTWHVNGDKPEVADASRVSGLLYTLFGVRGEAVLFEHAGDPELTVAGFGTPSLVVELAKRDGSAIATMLVAKDSDGNTVATQQGSGLIVMLASGQIDDISAKASDYLPGEAQATK